MNALQGKRIIITRPPHKAQAMADQLTARGAKPVIMPTIAIEPPQDTALLDKALREIDRYDFIAITSANAVTTLWTRIAELGTVPPLPPVGVVGKATANALEKYGVRAALVPDEHTAEALAQLMAQTLDLAGMRILLPQGDIARPVLENALSENGAQVDVITAYRTVRPKIDEELLANPFDVVTFTSPSTVYNFCDLFENPAEFIGAARIACIGPVTADAVQEKGLPVHIIAEPHTVEGLIETLSAQL